MEIVRYADRSTRAIGVGVRDGDQVRQVGADEPNATRELADLLRRPLAEIRSEVERARASGAVVADPFLLPPVDGQTEVWASGVTYERSRDARVEESSEKSVYERVYDAERPELFFKSVPWRVVTDREPIAVRADSELNVPEPELAVVVNAAGETIGYAVANDVSSRTVEGLNPLYLPQAKVYAGACALSTGIRPAWEIENVQDLAISLGVRRGGERVWHGETSTARMHRRLDDLVDWLYRQDAYPDGVVLATGTGIIPEMSFTLAAGDIVDIDIAEVGSLTNRVLAGTEGHRWLVAARTDPFAREGERG